MAQEIRDYCGFETRWGHLSLPSRIILCTTLGTLPCMELWSFASCSTSVTGLHIISWVNSGLFSSSQCNSKRPFLPYLSAISRLLWTSVPSGPSLSVPWASVSPGLSSCSSLFSEHLPPTAAPGEKPDLQGSQPTSSFHKIFLSLIERHLVGTSPLVLILLLGRVDLASFLV